MIEDEFKRLMDLFNTAAESNQVNLEEIFSQSIKFFDHLNLQLKNGTPDEKKAALKMMAEMYTQMNAQTKKICEKTGLSEEQLASFADNPSNFSKEQWESIGQAKEAMKETGQKLSKSLENLAEPTSEDSSKSPEKKHPHNPKKPKKSQWMRS